MTATETTSFSEVHPLGDYARKAYLEYAMSVVKGRALPSSCDGMKPVQRRIMFAMWEMGLISTAKPVKSARVVGDVLGKYHPHGDTACYEALVRVAQDFSLRYPLIDGQGNFGSRDGDGAAAMRYTECRLTPIAALLLSEVHQGTVEFGPNYDGSFQEPLLLPARLPMLLLNGASGIGVGLATEIPSHNLREVSDAACLLIKEPTASLSEVLKVLPGPDFPGGGHLISSASDIRAAYENGRGSLRMRGRWTFEEMARGQWQMVIHELPHGVSASKLLEELEAITNPQPKAGKKTITQEQAQLKATILAVLDGVRDESGKEASVRVVLSPKTSKIDREVFVNTILSTTSLECSVPINLVAVTQQGQPGTRNLLSLLHDWIGFRLDCVRRRLMHRLRQVNDRIHILEGRKLVLLHIDEVIAVIRESDNPKLALIERFKLSEVQADDILEIRLRQLARLEGIRIERELAELNSEKKKIEHLLSNDKAFREEVIKEIQADTKQFGDDRRTLIEEVSKASMEAPVVDDPVTLILSEKGWVRARNGHGVDMSTITYKDGDRNFVTLETSSAKQVVFFTSNGRAYSCPVSSLPFGRGDGQPLSSIFDFSQLAGAKIVGMISGAPEAKYVMTGSHGYGFICSLSDLIARNKTGKAFVSVGEKEIALPPQPIGSQDVQEGQKLAMLSDERLLVINLSDLRASSSGGKGLQLFSLSSGDQLTQVLPVRGDVPLFGSKKTGKAGAPEAFEKVLSGVELEPFFGKRASKGKSFAGLLGARVQILDISLGG